MNAIIESKEHSARKRRIISVLIATPIIGFAIGAIGVRYPLVSITLLLLTIATLLFAWRAKYF